MDNPADIIKSAIENALLKQRHELGGNGVAYHNTDANWVGNMTLDGCFDIGIVAKEVAEALSAHKDSNNG